MSRLRGAPGYYTEGAPTLTVRVNNQHREFRVDDVRAPWDLKAPLSKGGWGVPRIPPL